ncbi:enoyl-CoA hydratase/isomerase family protein [Aquipuribacter sp. MA13-6]|uniref:enoyl-CoA hydratase/isomerase family protein n=1 Tax=unclassified Aquipuribacter TaxID=2635084 RepID=UPI003EED01E5
MDVIEDLSPLPHLDVRRDDVDPAVLVVTLDDPQRRNVMSAGMTASWVRFTGALAQVSDVRAVVLTGAGTAFSSGGELSWLDDGTGEGAPVDDLRRRMSRYYEDWLSLRAAGVPVVVAVNGPAVGAGLGLALAGDVRLVADTAHLSVPFTALGLHPGMGVTHTLVATVGRAVATELLLTGRRVGAEEAVALGLASAVHPAAGLLEAALTTARQIASRAPVATRLVLQALAAGGHPDLAAALRWESLAQAVTLASSDLAEGLAAQRERRAPRFTGR